MIEHKEITYIDYNYLNDKSGYYLIKYNSGSIDYRVNGNLHHEFRPARILSYGREEYWLDGKRYGSNMLQDNLLYIPSNEYWIKFCKLKVFQ